MGPNFHVDLAWIDLKVAKQLLTYYWKQMMVAPVAKRKDYHDPCGINEQASFFHMKSFDHATSELLNCIRGQLFKLSESKIWSWG